MYVIVAYVPDLSQVDLRAHRKPPRLSLAPHLSCGHCLVDGVKPCRFEFTNRGGAGKFRVLPADRWPLDVEGEERFLWDDMPGGGAGREGSGLDSKVKVAPFEVSELGCLRVGVRVLVRTTRSGHVHLRRSLAHPRWRLRACVCHGGDDGNDALDGGYGE